MRHERNLSMAAKNGERHEDESCEQNVIFSLSYSHVHVKNGMMRRIKIAHISFSHMLPRTEHREDKSFNDFLPPSHPTCVLCIL